MPEQVGRYRILSQLGRGGMGVVYLAEDPLLHRKVAIKMLDLSVDEGSQKEFLQDRLLRDARAAAALSHPNIVSIHDVLEEGGAAYVVMEYLAGESLAAYLKHDPLPEPAFVVKVLRAMAAGLDYTHGCGIVHRDIKPANAMFDAVGTLKILDFGIARLSDASTATPTGMVIGTVQYMAPEQIKGEKLDGRADQFSLAAVAYQMMTGSTLFGYHTLATLTYKIVNEMPPPMQTRNASLPATVDVVVAKALSKSPDGRFPSCSAFVDALDAALSGGVYVHDKTSLATPAAYSAPTAGSCAAGKTRPADRHRRRNYRSDWERRLSVDPEAVGSAERADRSRYNSRLDAPARGQHSAAGISHAASSATCCRGKESSARNPGEQSGNRCRKGP